MTTAVGVAATLEVEWSLDAQKEQLNNTCSLLFTYKKGKPSDHLLCTTYPPPLNIKFCAYLIPIAMGTESFVPASASQVRMTYVLVTSNESHLQKYISIKINPTATRNNLFCPRTTAFESIISHTWIFLLEANQPLCLCHSFAIFSMRGSTRCLSTEFHQQCKRKKIGC